MAFVLEQKEQKGERLPDWYVEGSPCAEKSLDIALAWYSRAKTLRTAGFDGIVIDELRLEEFGRKRLGLGDYIIELFIRVINEFVYVENAVSKDPQWEYGDPIKETEDAESSPQHECGDQP